MMNSPVRDTYPGLSMSNCRTFLPLRKGPPRLQRMWSKRARDNETLEPNVD
jgi:hypothetical protein